MSTRFTGLSRGRVATRGAMNRTEAEYAQYLDEQVAAGRVLTYWFESINLRLSAPEAGKGAYYCPDFLILYPDGRTRFVDVKGTGPVNDAAIVRIKCAAERYSLWEFVLATKQTKAKGGGFVEKHV